MRPGKLEFSGFVLDRESGRLLGRDGEIRLRAQAFRLLEVLIEEAPRILSQDELLDRAWGVEHLSPASVKQAVSEIRQALGDDPARPSIIETVHRRGYRFISAVTPWIQEPDPPAPRRAPDLSTRPIPTLPREMEEKEESAPAAPASPLLRRVGLGLALIAVAALTLGLAARFFPAWETPERPTPRVAAAAARPALALLGFKNLSGDPGDEWISGALTELLSFELTAAGRVRLIPGDRVARMKRELKLTGGESHSKTALARIGGNLGSDLLLAGSFLREEGGRLRLQVLVQDARTGETLAWARETGTPETLAALAAAAAQDLQATFGGHRSGEPLPEAAALASSSESLRLYTEALERLRTWDDPAALRLLETAVAADPESPFVQDALAAAALRLGFKARAREASRKAVALAAGLPPEIRLGMHARSREAHDEWEEAAKIHAELHRSFPDDLEHGLRLAEAQRRAGRTRESLETVAALRRLPAGDDPRLDLAEADAAWQLGDSARSLQAAERGIARAGERGLALVSAAGRFDRAWALSRLGRPDEALADFAAARTLYLRLGDRGAAAGALLGRASILQATGRTGEAWKAYEDAISALREIGDRNREARALNNFATVLNDEGDLAGVVPLLERSLEIKRETGDLQGAATSLVGLGNALRLRGDFKGAHLRIGEALDLSRSLGDANNTAFALRNLARLLAKERRFAEARPALEEALALSAGIGDGKGTAEARMALGDLEAATGNRDRAREHFLEALAGFRRLKLAADAAFATLQLGELHHEMGRPDEARRFYQQALAAAREIRNEFYEAHSHVGLAKAATLSGRPGVAREEYRKALILWEKQGNREAAEQVRKALSGV